MTLETSQEVIISLIQSDQVRKRMESDDGAYENSVEPIGFSLFSIPNRIMDLFAIGPDTCQRIESSGIYLYKREVNKKVYLNAGTYLLIPSVFDKDISMDYVLRIFYFTSKAQTVKIQILEKSIKKPNKPRESSICTII